MPEWIASEIILTDPLNMPAKTFNMISAVFDMIDNKAIFTFLSHAPTKKPPIITLMKY
jgi:hypothetical protein